MTISQRIFLELEKQKKSQKEMSEATGIPTSTISAWNKRGTTPSADVVYPVAQFLGLSLEYLLVGEDAANGNTISTGDITGNNNANITTTNSDNNTEFEKEFSSILSGLTFRERTELMTVIYQFADEHKIH